MIGHPAKRHLAAIVGAAIVAASCGATGSGSRSAASISRPGIHWRWINAPAGADVPGAQWLEIGGAGSQENIQVAAYIRPSGPGPYPLVIHFHGGAGFHSLDVLKAKRFTAAGFAVFVGCWLYTTTKPTLYQGVPYPTIPCLQNRANEDDAARALIEVARSLPDVRRDSIGLSGGSASGHLVLDAVAAPTDVRAVVVDSADYGPAKVYAPVLLLGGTADDTFPIDEQRSYAEMLRSNGSTVESHYYVGGVHGVTYFGSFQDDAVQRMTAFFKQYFSGSS